jgi:Tol biopolymer transport system component
MKKFKLLIFLLLSSIAFSQSNSAIYLIGSINDVSMNPTFSPDGQKIAFTKEGYKGIWVYYIPTKSSKQISDEPAAGFGYKWSSDSKSILTRVAKYEEMKRLNAVKVFEVETKQSQQLTDFKTRMPYLPEWSEQDTKVILPTKESIEVYSSGKLNKSVSAVSEINAYSKYDKIVARNASIGTEKILEPIKDAQIINLVTSPDKNKVAFEIMGGNMYSMNIDGTNLVDLGKGNRPRWSSDSKEIVYMITEDDGHDFTASDIYSINADGAQKKNLTNTADKIEMNPCFSPDGKSIVFDVYNDGSIYLMNIEYGRN